MWSAGLQIKKCEFRSNYFFIYLGSDTQSSNSLLKIDSSILEGSNAQMFSRFSNVQLTNSTFLDKAGVSTTNDGISIYSDLRILIIKNSVFTTGINFNRTRIGEMLRIESSKLSRIAINTFKLPQDQYEFYCKWSVLKTSLSYLQKKYVTQDNGDYRYVDTYYNLYSDSSVYNQTIHDELKSKLYQIYNIYKAQGDVESYNACYRDIKLFENKRWKYLYVQDPTFEKLFHWRLNQLISIYSDYGTNPAKAVIKSLWVILFFTFFYMLFPSEWDISSKTAVIANLKKAVDKKEKTTSPIFKAILFLLVSFANAFTLSLNSFVTLGFGHIPTKGVAKYFTILQGFIGWFLLTIFSVSLISQVLN